ncbi:MAG: ATP-binding protein, partial [candidate division WOR-3 bacterium]
MSFGFFEKLIDEMREEALKNNFVLTPKAIAEALLKFPKAEMDAHLVIGGQNGVGKSYLMLAIAKELLRLKGKDSNLVQAYHDETLNFIFASMPKQIFANLITQTEERIFLIDELKPFFDYKLSQTKIQTHLYNAVEVARFKRHIFIGCARDYTKLDLNYRNAKAQMLIYLFDRVVSFNKRKNAYETRFTYGSVFASNISMEFEDKFMFSMIRGYDMKTTRVLCEKLPTWVGHILVYPPITYGLTKGDLLLYKDMKEYASRQYMQNTEPAPKRAKREISDVEELQDELKKVRL